MVSLFLFLGSFAVFLHTAGPWLVPYRDAGEMSVLLSTLSVAHPPGYPLYTLLGKIFLNIPFGSIAYRANIFSGFFGAAALVVFYWGVRRITDRTAALLAAGFLGFSFPFWELASVSEMYTLGVFWLALILLTCLVPERRNLFPFVYALGLGVRMDLLLILPIFVLWLFWEGPRPSIKYGVMFFTLGLTVFLYLTVRSLGNPLIDWGNPESLGALFASMSRKSYSGTLDLLSLSYKTGENFWINMVYYAKHLFASFGLLGIFSSIFGFYFLLKTNRKTGVLIGVLFLISGPLFLFLANMPPNPHALAIVEASYLMPDVFFVVLIGAGLFLIMKKIPINLLTVPVMILFLAVNAISGYDRCSKRNNFYVRDYIANVMRSLPPRSVAVFHKDVQLFSLWYSQLVDGKRPDVSFISSGLSGSLWYWDMKKRWGIAPAPEISVKSPAGWLEMKAALVDRPFVSGFDVDVPADFNLPLAGSGAVLVLGPTDINSVTRSVHLLKNFMLRRGEAHYGETFDFFSSDLIGDLSRAYRQQAVPFLLGGNLDEALWLLDRARNLDPMFPTNSSDLGYYYFSKGDFAKARTAYEEAARKNLSLLEDAKKFRSLPSVVKKLKGDLSGVYISLGGTLEKLGEKGEARKIYEKALEQGGSAQAHYNLAVTYWGEDWSQVVRHLELALRINPSMGEAQKYYPIALSKVKK